MEIMSSLKDKMKKDMDRIYGLNPEELNSSVLISFIFHFIIPYTIGFQ